MQKETISDKLSWYIEYALQSQNCLTHEFAQPDNCYLGKIYNTLLYGTIGVSGKVHLCRHINGWECTTAAKMCSSI